MVKIQWLPEAQNDLNCLYNFIEPHSQSVASLAIATLYEAVETLKRFPEYGRPSNEDIDYRELFVKFGANGYVIRYQYINGEVLTMRVWHARENRSVRYTIMSTPVSISDINFFDIQKFFSLIVLKIH